MSLSSNEELLTTMFAVHGKRPMDAQFNEYLKIFDKLGFEKAERLFKHVRDEEDRFPTIKQLWGIINSMGLIERKQEQLESYDDCYYCGGVGYVPRMFSPRRDKTLISYVTRVYACQCKAGMSLPKTLPRYFAVFDAVQFEPMDGLNYPQLVTRKQIELNNKLHEEKNNGGENETRSREHTKKLGAQELRATFERITGTNIADENR